MRSSGSINSGSVTPEPSNDGSLIWRVTAGFSVTVMLLLASFAARAEINMPVGVTPISKEVYGLHMLIFWICCVIGVAVFGVMFYSMFKHRKSKGAVAADFHESTLVEIIWTAVPLFILIAMAIPAAKTLIAMEDTSNCLLYTSPSPRDATLSRMPSSA